MSDGRRLERYRSAYYKLRAVLHDRRANLAAFPARTDAIRHLLDRRTSIGVIHLALDDLAAIESIHGWQTHDEVLAAAAAHARAAAATLLHPDSVVALNRVAGEAIVCFAPAPADGSEWTPPALAGMAARMRRRVQGAFDDPGFRTLDPPVEVHVGHAFLGLNPFYRFERAIYRAIDRAARQESERRVRRDLDRATEVERLLAEGALRMHFQPVVELETGIARGYEALARGPKDSPVERPTELWRATRRVGGLGRLERLCRARAFEEAAGLPGDGDLFFNVSADAVRSGLLEGSPPSACDGRFRIVVDLSERELDDGDERGFEEAVEALRRWGFAVALDDLGSGGSRFETLERVRPDYLKVDASVVRGIERHPIKQEVLESLLEFSTGHGARLVAEGVETAEEADYLEKAGVPLGQGFYWSDPLPVSSLPVHR